MVVHIKVGENTKDKNVVAIWASHKVFGLPYQLLKYFAGKKMENEDVRCGWERRPTPATFFH
ncbi:MAG TPA: hypothetical protein VF622_15900 [Segetibacter sp.]|jgi:hypothetical protein